MNNLLPLILLMSGFNNKGCDCESDESSCECGNGFGSLLPLLFLARGFGGGNNSCGCKS